MPPRIKEFTERINVFFTPEQLERIKKPAEIDEKDCAIQNMSTILWFCRQRIDQPDVT